MRHVNKHRFSGFALFESTKCPSQKSKKKNISNNSGDVFYSFAYLFHKCVKKSDISLCKSF